MSSWAIEKVSGIFPQSDRHTPVSPAELLVFEEVKTLLAEQDLAQALRATSLSRRDLTRKSESAC